MKTLFLKKLRLTHFRNTHHVVMDGFKHINYIYGQNGVGKTNILDALTRFISITGLKNQSSKLCTNVKFPENGWGVDCVFDMGGYDGHFTTGLLPKHNSRIIKYNGEKITQNHVLKMIPCLWLTPVGDKIFTHDAADIRTYFYDMMGLFSPDFSQKYASYERACRQRLKILTTDTANISHDWLSAIEHEISVMALDIIQMRRVFLNLFDTYQKQHSDILSVGLPDFTLSMNCDTQNIIDIAEYQKKLHAMRISDMGAKRTLFGVHRAKFSVFNVQKQIDIAFCSTGEQKAILMFILFIMNQALMDLSNIPPIILLDDAFAHFDTARIHFLQEHMGHLPNHIFITGTHFDITLDNKNALFHIHDDFMLAQHQTLF